MKTFDPDQDGYTLNEKDALSLHKNVNILHYVRRSILVNKSKQFEQSVSLLERAETSKPKIGWSH